MCTYILCMYSVSESLFYLNNTYMCVLCMRIHICACGSIYIYMYIYIYRSMVGTDFLTFERRLNCAGTNC